MSDKQSNNDISDEIALLNQLSSQSDNKATEALESDLFDFLKQVDPALASKVRESEPVQGVTVKPAPPRREPQGRWMWWMVGALALGTVVATMILRPFGLKAGTAPRSGMPSNDTLPSVEPLTPMATPTASVLESVGVAPSASPQTTVPASPEAVSTSPAAMASPEATPQVLTVSAPPVVARHEDSVGVPLEKPVTPLVRHHDRAAVSAHVVRKGESLSLIALRHLGRYQRWPEIYSLNRQTVRDPNVIRVGQRLVLPPSGWRVKTTLYRSRPGDTLRAIAERHYGDASRWSQVYELNRNAVQDPLLLRPGTLLQLPAVRRKPPVRHATVHATAGTFGRHRVRSGDSLRLLAQRYLGSASRWQEIYQANRTSISHPHWIYPGQVLRIPHHARQVRSRYVVRSGDSLWVIAIRHGGAGEDWRAWYEANRDRIADPHWIWPGQSLRVPGF